MIFIHNNIDPYVKYYRLYNIKYTPFPLNLIGIFDDKFICYTVFLYKLLLVVCSLENHFLLTNLILEYILNG